MTVPSYTEEDVELVARALADSLNDSCFAEKNTGTRWESFRAVYRQDARTALAALSSSNRLVPPGSEVREEWGVELAHHSGGGTWDHGSAFVEVYDDQDDADRMTAYMASVCGDRRPVRTMRRIAAYGPWSPSVPDTEDET